MGAGGAGNVGPCRPELLGHASFPLQNAAVKPKPLVLLFQIIVSPVRNCKSLPQSIFTAKY